MSSVHTEVDLRRDQLIDRIGIDRNYKILHDMGKHWRPEEIALACKAYADVTRNPIQGADQRLSDFSSDLLEK